MIMFNAAVNLQLAFTRRSVGLDAKTRPFQMQCEVILHPTNIF
jgi:hypothetical protein